MKTQQRLSTEFGAKVILTHLQKSPGSRVVPPDDEILEGGRCRGLPRLPSNADSTARTSAGISRARRVGFSARKYLDRDISIFGVSDNIFQAHFLPFFRTAVRFLGICAPYCPAGSSVFGSCVFCVFLFSSATLGYGRLATYIASIKQFDHASLRPESAPSGYLCAILSVSLPSTAAGNQLLIRRNSHP